jgi:hypothetical protein
MQAMQLHLDEMFRAVARGAHAVLLLDRAGWHTTGRVALPQNITIIFLPSRARNLPGLVLRVLPEERKLERRIPVSRSRTTPHPRPLCLLNRAAGGRGSRPARLAGSIASVEKRTLTASGAPRRA